MGNKQALLVGINEYGKDSGLASLHYAEEDARALAETLRQDCGFETQTLLGKEATGVEIQKRVTALPEGELFLFFFAGHGQMVQGQFCLHTAESLASGVGALSWEALSRWWRYNFGFGQVLAVLDACRNEYDWAKRGARGFAASRDIERSMAGESLVEVLYGCSDGEVSYEESDFGHGVFTNALLRVLRDESGEVDSGTLAARANDLMGEWCRRTGKRQKAKRYYEPSERHRIVLRSGAAEAGAVSAPASVSGPVIAAPELVECPLCGKYNPKSETFRCRQCGEADLCLRHQDGRTYLCEVCEREKERVKAESSVPAQAAVPAPEAPAATHTNSLGMEFVLIPAGTFQMGCTSESEDCGNSEKPRHRVTISRPFYLGKYEVTQAQWEAVMGSNPSRFKGSDRPVESVSWNDVQEFIRKLNAKEGHERYRLPTEAEWEYAARAGSGTAYSFGNDAGRLGDYAWYDGNSGNKTHPVGKKRANAWGLHDMHGNVWEWVQDWCGDYSAGAVVDPQGPSAGGIRVLRGGGWDNHAGFCRAASRNWNGPDFRSDYYGFRLALDPGQ